MEVKLCKKCNKEKSTNDFRENRNHCRECERKYAEEYRKKYHKLTLESTKKWRKNNKDKIKKYNKENRKKYNYEITEERKLYSKNYMKKWRRENKEHIKEYKRKEYHKNKDNELYKFKIQIRNLISISFEKKGYKKGSKTEKILGCNYETFINHLLETYKKNYGVEWDKIDSVHIDHIKPLSLAQTENDIIELNHYTNLQLLKAKDNLKKSNKLDWRLNDD